MLMPAFHCLHGLFSLTWLSRIWEWAAAEISKLEPRMRGWPPAVTRARRGQALASDWSVVNYQGSDWSNSEADKVSYLKSVGVKRLCKSFILIHSLSIFDLKSKALTMAVNISWLGEISFRGKILDMDNQIEENVHGQKLIMNHVYTRRAKLLLSDEIY